MAAKAPGGGDVALWSGYEPNETIIVGNTLRRYTSWTAVTVRDMAC